MGGAWKATAQTSAAKSAPLLEVNTFWWFSGESPLVGQKFLSPNIQAKCTSETGSCVIKSAFRVHH